MCYGDVRHINARLALTYKRDITKVDYMKDKLSEHYLRFCIPAPDCRLCYLITDKTVWGYSNEEYNQTNIFLF
jgi:hypothetical protein